MSTEKKRQLRRARRVELGCTLRFSSEETDGEVEGDATITNISTSGCSAASDINLAEGLNIQVTIQLPDKSPPVKVARASVRWVSGNAFGLSFILFLPSERARLRTFLENIKK